MNEPIGHKIQIENAEPRFQLLSEHLDEVAKLAERFSSSFGFGPWGKVAGQIHDAGKYQHAFQDYIRNGGRRGSVHHASTGALEALKNRNLPLAFVVQGHHGGLPSRSRFSEYEWKTEADRCLIEAIAGGWTPPNLALLRQPSWLEAVEKADRPYVLECVIRFLFSALVDADFLDTELFMNPDQASFRQPKSIKPLLGELEGYLKNLMSVCPDTQVNHFRRKILEKCVEASQFSQGAFTLTVPTGGGKTLASMAFALHHAAVHHLERVIVTIPYTSIIEQNAAIYRKIFGDEGVLEHHSALDPERESTAHRLSAENWDAPIVVTTNVQLLESLFANRTSRCRKIHNIARSVIILDEVQTLPPGLLLPTLNMLRCVTKYFGVSTVFCTATQPAFQKRVTSSGTDFRGIGKPQEIVDDGTGVFSALKRVKVNWPKDTETCVDWTDLAAELMIHSRILAIVNRRADARTLCEMLPGDSIHLSALMIPEHRTQVLASVYKRLEDPNESCRLVATSLVEAGVDLDFPVVYRAMAPLDSIAQAAGRCNREGRLVDQQEKKILGSFHVFIPPTKPLPGSFAAGTQVTLGLLRAGRCDISDPDIYHEYFERLYDSREKDEKGIQALREQLDFPEISRRYRLIEDGWSQPVLIPWDKRVRRTIDAIRAIGSSRQRFRILQRYSVNIPKSIFATWKEQGIVEPLFSYKQKEDADDGPHILSEEFMHSLYDDRYGLRVEQQPELPQDSLIV